MQLDNRTFELKATRVATLVGFDITFPFEERNIAYLKHNDHEFSFDNDGWEARHERIVIHGGMPYGKDGYCPDGCPPVTITVSQNKTAEQIVKDIKRRFLPEYTANFHRARVAIEENDAYISGRNEQMFKLSRATGVSLNSMKGSTSNEGFIWIGGVTFRPGDSMGIAIDRLGFVPTDKAIKIAKILMDSDN